MAIAAFPAIVPRYIHHPKALRGRLKEASFVERVMENVPKVRQHIVRMLEPYFSDTQMMDLEVAIGEAVNNAVRHGIGAYFSFSIYATDELVCLEITNQCESFPRVPSCDMDDLDAESGRGIPLMKILTDKLSFIVRGRQLTTLMTKKRD